MKPLIKVPQHVQVNGITRIHIISRRFHARSDVVDNVPYPGGSSAEREQVDPVVNGKVRVLLQPSDQIDIGVIERVLTA